MNSGASRDVDSKGIENTVLLTVKKIYPDLDIDDSAKDEIASFFQQLLNTLL